MSGEVVIPATSMALSEIKALGAFFEELKAIDTALPFDLLPSEPVTSKESATVALFDLPKLGQTTQGEEFIWSHFIDSLTDATGEIDWDAMPIERAYRMRCVGATLMLMFRHDPTWNVGKTLQLGAVQVLEVYQFFLSERTGWRQHTPEAETEPAPETVTTKKPRSTSGRKPSGDSATTSPAIDASTTEPLAVAV